MKKNYGMQPMDFSNQALGVMCPNTRFQFRNGNNLYSESKEFFLSFQSDGNMVIYHSIDGKDVAIWASNTQNTPQAWDFDFQEDGHLIAKDEGGDVRWKSQVYDWYDSLLVMQNDGNLVEYDRSTSKPVWWSGSFKVVDKKNVDVHDLIKQCFTAAPSASPISNPTPLPTTEPSLRPVAPPTFAPTRWTNLFITPDRAGHKSREFSINAELKNSLISLGGSDGPSCVQAKAPLQGFGFSATSDESHGYWDYKCAHPSDEDFAYQGLTSKTSNQQSVGDDSNGGIIYFDRQAAYCDVGSYMTSFSFLKSGSGLKMSYECVSYASMYLQAQCVEVASNYNENGNSIVYLDRHNIECGSDMGLQGFRGQSKNGFLRVVGTCCPGLLTYPSQNPTSAPVADKTERPSAIPTVKPSSTPVSKPTLAPYATPTLFPTLHPTNEPNAEPTQHPTEYPSREPISHPTLAPIPEPTLAPNIKLQMRASKIMKEEAEQALEKAEVARDHAQEEKEKAIEDEKKAKEAMQELKDRSVDKSYAEVDAVKEQKKADAIVEARKKAVGEAGQEKSIVKKLRLDDQVIVAAKEYNNKIVEEEGAEEIYKKALKDEIKEDIDGDISADELDYARISKNAAVEAKDAAIVKLEHAQANYDNALADLAAIEAIVDDSPETLACPFTFVQGVDKVEVPDGCLFIGTNDVTFEKQRRMEAPAAYYCTKKSVPLQLVYHDLIEIGLNNSISFLQPGHDAMVRFYQEDMFMGQQAEFEVDNHKPLNSFLYDDRTSTNDRVKSLVFLSYAMKIPSSCNDLNFNKAAMKLNLDLMKEGGKFFAKSNPKNYALKEFKGPLELNRVDDQRAQQFVPNGLFESKEAAYWNKAQASSKSAASEKVDRKSDADPNKVRAAAKPSHSPEWYKSHSQRVVEQHREVKKAADAVVKAKKAVIDVHEKAHNTAKFSGTPKAPAAKQAKPVVHQHSAEWFKSHPDYAKKVAALNSQKK